MFFDPQNIFLAIFGFIIVQLTLSQNFTEETEKTTEIRSNHKFDDISKFSYNVYCKFQANQYKCQAGTATNRFFFDITLQECTTFQYGQCNHSYNVFTTKNQCRTQCIDYAYHTVFPNLTENIYCRFQPDFGQCNSYYPMWYFDISDFRCKGFAYSGCGGNYNRFSTSTQCASVCGAAVRHKD